MKKKTHPVQFQEATTIEDALALQENDVISPIIYQYVTSMKRKPASGRSDARVNRLISQSIWPRLVAMRIRTVLVTSIPLINLMNNEYLIDGLNHTQLFLEILGWALHALRLLINLLRLFNCCFSSEENTSTWQTRLKAEFSQSWVELGNDLLWVVTTLTPVIHITVSLALIVMDIAWIVYCGWVEISRLNHFKHDFGQLTHAGSMKPQGLSEIKAYQDDLKNRFSYAQKKLILSVLTALSTTLLTLLRTAIMPVLLPTLAINPLLLLGFALLALLITLTSHFIGEWLKNKKPSEKIGVLEKNTPVITTSRITFFKPANKKRFKQETQSIVEQQLIFSAALGTQKS